MASIGHIALGMAAGRLYASRVERDVKPWRAIVVCAALSMVPDLDVISFPLGIKYAEPFGHRGFTHSIFFCVVGALLSLTLAKPLKLEPLPLATLVFLVLLQHPLLDMLTDGGLGCAIFFPSNVRWFFPVQPIPVAPIGRAFLSDRGLGVAMTELAMFGVFLLYALWPRRAKSL